MGNDATKTPLAKGAAKITPKDKNEIKAERESEAAPISKPGGFDNDPKDPTNPNEMRERTLKKLHRREPAA